MDKNSPFKWNFWTFEWLDEKPPNSTCHIWNTCQSFLNLCINLQCHEKKVFCTSLTETLYDFYKSNPPKCKISDLQLLRLNFTKFVQLVIYKISAKKVQKSYVSWYWRVVQNLKKKRFFASKMTRIWWILIRALRSLKNLPFDWSVLCKVYDVWPKKVQRSCNSWHWGVMQNLKKKWLVVWKMTWGIWQIFIRTLETVKIGTFMGPFV